MAHARKMQPDGLKGGDVACDTDRKQPKGDSCGSCSVSGGLQIGCEIAVDIGKPYIGRMTLDVPKVDLSMEAAYEEYLACPGQYRGYEVQGYGEIVCPVSTSVFVLRLATLRARFMMLELVGEARSAPPLLVGDNVWFGGCLDGTSLIWTGTFLTLPTIMGGEVTPCTDLSI